MEEIKVGEYIRTKKGEIHKVIAIEVKKDPEDWNYYKYENDMGDFEMFVVKHSSNIIDLIEVGDYVNGVKVTETGVETIRCDLGFGCIRYFYETDIKSIVTKEQFNSIKYEVI